MIVHLASKHYSREIRRIEPVLDLRTFGTNLIYGDLDVDNAGVSRLFERYDKDAVKYASRIAADIAMRQGRAFDPIFLTTLFYQFGERVARELAFAPRELNMSSQGVLDAINQYGLDYVRLAAGISADYRRLRQGTLGDEAPYLLEALHWLSARDLVDLVLNEGRKPSDLLMYDQIERGAGRQNTIGVPLEVLASNIPVISKK